MVSKSDWLGGVVKSFVSRSVNSEGTVGRNTMGFYQFCTENRTFRNHDSVVNNRCFILVKPEDLENSWDQVAKCPYKTIPRTQKLHQIENRHSMSSGIYARNYLCTFAYPTEIRISKIVTQSLQILSGQVLKWFASISSLTGIKRVLKCQILIVMHPLDDNDAANSDGVISKSVSSLLQDDDIAVIRADDPVFFFYLIKVTQEETIL